jgi:hypothetical protein
MLFEGMHHALNVFQLWASNLCVWELRSDIHIPIPINGPPIGKKEVLISFALIACNVVS